MAKRQQPGCGCCGGCDLVIKVYGLNGLGVPGLTVNVKSGGVTVYTGTTDSGGVATIPGAAGSFDVEVVDNRTPSRWVTETFSGRSLACGVQSSLTLSGFKTGFRGGPACADPISETLYYTDSNGTWTLTYNTLLTQWAGCGTHASMANVVTALAAGPCTPTVGTGSVQYAIRLGFSATTPQFSESWGYYAAPGSQRTSATATCSSGTMDTTANIPGICIGSIGSVSATATGTLGTCPPSLSITGTMPATAGSGFTVTNPGGGSFTLTE